MKKILTIALAVLLVAAPAWAFLYEIEILTVEQIQKLSDDDLIERYIEAKIEEKASGEFHVGAGFSSKKEYQSRKKLLRYIYDLRKEIGDREKVKVESVDEYLD